MLEAFLYFLYLSNCHVANEQKILLVLLVAPKSREQGFVLIVNRTKISTVFRFDQYNCRSCYYFKTILLISSCVRCMF